MNFSKKILHLFFGFFIAFSLLFFQPKPVDAITIIQNTQCSGSFSCSYWGSECSYAGCSEICTLDQRGDNPPADENHIGCGVCTCPVETGSRSCSTAPAECGTDPDCVPFECHIDDGPCNVGENAAEACTFTDGSSGGSGSSCGNNICQAGETTSCPGDCPACGSGFTLCGGCINSCRDTSGGKTCDDYIAEECTSQTSCNSQPYWCITEALCNAQQGTHTWGGHVAECDSAATPEIEADCCTACRDGQYSEVAGCGPNNGCAQCQQKLTWRAISDPNTYCAPTCVADSTCNASSCSPRCGQTSSCGGVCSNADSGTPTYVTISPANGSQIEVTQSGSTYQGTITWSDSALADNYRVRFYAQGGACNDQNGDGTTGDTADCGLVGDTNSYTFDIIDGVNDYTFRVQPVNGICSAYGGTRNGPFSTINFSIVGRIAGNFRDDPNSQATLAGSICNLGGAAQISPGTGATIGADTLTGSVNGTITGTTFSILAPFWPSGDNTVTLTPGVATSGIDYQCTCPVGCSYSGISSPQSGVRFYLAELDLSNRGWWQTINGNVFAERSIGTAMSSYIPVDTCTASGTCTPAVLTQDSSATDESAGIALTGGGAIDTTDTAGSQTGYIAERTTQLFSTASTPTKFRENFDYFFRESNLDSTSTDDFITTFTDATKPTTPPTGNKSVYFRRGNLTIQQAWNVAANESIIVIVDGSITFSDPSNIEQLVSVADGGFIAFIASGNINFDTNLGNDTLTSTIANVEGIYIADAQIRILSKGAAAGGDERFIGEGTFVGWNGVDLLRDFDDGGIRKAENNDKAIELFRFRPDLILNTPALFTKPHYVWQETN